MPELVIPDFTIFVHQGASEETIADMIDSVSETITTDDGLPFCGSIVLELVDSE